MKLDSLDSSENSVALDKVSMVVERRIAMENRFTKKLERLSFDEVMSVFLSEHNLEHGTNDWAKWALEEANKKVGGKWYVCEMNTRLLLDVVLPHHKDGEIELVSPGGITVKEALRKIQCMPDYSKKCPGCWSKIEYARSRNFNPIFLSDKPIWEYSHHVGDESQLFHLDGLHRMIAWAMDGRLNEGQKLIVYLAS